MSTPRTVRVGSRKSPLAIAQSEEVVAKLRAQFPLTEFTIVHISTGGDRDKVSSLQVLGRGIFSKDIEDALLRGDVDLAAHSAKDLAPDLPEGRAFSAPQQSRSFNNPDCPSPRLGSTLPPRRSSGQARESKVDRRKPLQNGDLKAARPRGGEELIERY